MKLFSIVLTALFLFSSPGYTAIPSDSSTAPQGFRVLTKSASGWVTRGTLHYDSNFTEKAFDLSRFLPDVDGEYKVRIQHGPEGMANLDSLFLKTGKIQVVPSEAFDVYKKKDFLKKLAIKDYDVINAHGRTIELKFTAPSGPQKTIAMQITGREEDPQHIPGGPCAYPSSLHPTPDQASVYSYILGQNYGALTVDGAFTNEDKLTAPLFSNFTKPISGHPDGMTYGYLKNDDKFLYGAIDFTSDNTFDGKADFAAILIKTAKGWKRFQVSVGKNQWGQHGFTYTDKVAYQHKIYEFKIPLSELEVSQSGQGLEMKFLAYGTATCPDADGIAMSLGAQNPTPGTQWLGNSNLTQVMAQLSFLNGANTVWVGSITIVDQGTGSEVVDVASVKLYSDANGDGAVDAGDTLVATGTFNPANGTALLTVSPDNGLILNEAVTANALIVYEINSTATSGSTYAAMLVSNDDVTVNANSPCDNGTTFTGASLTGNTLTVQYGTTTIAAGANNPSAGSVSSGQTNVPMLQVAVSAGSAEVLDMGSMTINDYGGAGSASLISAVRFWEDADGSGTVTDGDTQLNTDQTFTAGTNTLALNTDAAGSQIAASGTKNYLVTYSFASALAALDRGMTSPLKGIRWAKATLLPWLMPLSLSGCGGGGGATRTTIQDAPDGFIFTDTNGNIITSSAAGEIVQVRTADDALLIFSFTMGDTSVSLDGAALGRDANGTLVALNAGSSLSLTIEGSLQAVSGLPESITVFVPCDADDNTVRVCPNETSIPTDSSACTGEILLSGEEATSGGYTWGNTDRTGTDDCEVSGAVALFDSFYGEGVTQTIFQATLNNPGDLELTGNDSSHTVNPSSTNVQGGGKTLVSP